TKDQQRYSERARQITEAFNRAFLDASTGRYALGTQACQAFALYLDLVPPELREKAVEVLTADIARHKNHLTTGIFGTKFMLMALSDAGRPDLVAAIVAQRDFPGWGHMLERGATTLWEHWEFSDNTYSHNHPMFGSVSEWFMKVPGGIRPADDAVGFDRIEIRPAILPSLEWASARYESARGPIGTAWRRTADTLELEVEVPANTTARVHVPAATAE